MKTNKIILGFSIIAATGFFVAGCNKKANVAPEADLEVQSTVDASYATSIITDIDDICGYLGEGYTDLNAIYLSGVGMNASNFITYSTVPTSSMVSIVYNGTVTCYDGKKRSGKITLDYSASNATFNAKNYRDAGFVGKVTLNNYVVDGWSVYNNTTFTITNTTPSGYNPTSVPLTWKLDGRFTMFPGTGTVTIADSSTITWNGTLTKTLANSTSSLILNPNKLIPIRWSANTSTASPGAKCSYKGTATGLVQKSIFYTVEITDALMRDFSCSPNSLVLAPAPSSTVMTNNGMPNGIPVKNEWHPIIVGIASYSISGATDPRVVDYASGGAGCDNNGTIYIKGISYPVDFRK